MNLYQTVLKRFSIVAKLFLLTVILTVIIQAQTSSVDFSFDVNPEKNSAPGTTNFILQPDNKIIVFDDFQVVNGVINNRIARLNTDGSLDNTFNCATCDFSITSAVVQPDGKIIIAGNANTGNALVLQPRIYRLNADGSRDIGFTSPFPNIVFPQSDNVDVQAVQPDGKILVVLYSNYGNSYNYTLYRLNPNGAIDNTFSTIQVAGGSGGTFGENPGKISLLTDGKIFVVTNTFVNCPGCTPGRATLKRYNTDGTSDSTFEPPSATVNNNNNGSALINDFDVQSDGSVIIVGSFIAVNGSSRQNVAKILPAGNVDLSFNSSNIAAPDRVKILPNGKILISTSNQFYLLNADGSPNNSFTSPTNIKQINNWTLDSAGKIFLSAVFLENGVNVNKFARLNQDGSIESSFTVNFGIAASITAIAAQTDGKVVFAGDFIRVNGVPRVSIARVNTDGSLDTTFNSGSGFDGRVSKIIVQTDGKILVAGSFYNYNGTSRPSIARLNADGSLDSTFNPSLASGTVNTIALQSDGKILIGGTFGSVNGTSRTSIARLNIDGSLDMSFNPTLGNASITSVVVQSDGKIMVGGSFSGVNGFNRTNLVRLNADGTLDTSFNAGNISTVIQIEIQTDGRYLILTNTIVRLNSNGATDSTFTSPTFNGGVYQFLGQPDGGILVGGDFSSINNAPRLNFARLLPDGTLDSSFFPSGANGVVRTIVRQADGRILIGGGFSAVENVTRGGVARLIVPETPTCTYALSANSTNVNSAGGTGSFNVTSGVGCTWTAISNASWITITSGSSGTGNGTVSYSVQANATGVSRTGTITVNDQIFTVNQAAACSYSLSATSANFGVMGGNGSVNITTATGCNWTASSNNDWIRNLSGATGTGSGTLSYSVTANNGIARTGTLIFGGQTFTINQLGRTAFDFDGDGRADVSVFRPSSGVWYELHSQNNSLFGLQFGQQGDRLAPADYDGDGKTDIAVFRDNIPGAGNFAYFFIIDSSDNSFHPVHFGATGDVPVSGDWDGDGKADLAVYRDGSLTGGQSYIFYRPSSQPGVDFRAIAWGAPGDKPVMGDFDGDGKLDAAVFRSSNGVWYVLKSSDNQVIQVQFGLGTDISVPADYNGDGVTDIAVYRPSNGYWYIARSTANAAQNFDAIQFGAPGDVPVPADYDGDRKADVAVYRPSNGGWYLLLSTQGFTSVQFGVSEDKPIPNAYIR